MNPTRRTARQITLPGSHFAAVDGLRAVAILSVLVFHTGLYSNGLFGVDIFFVLSGFLITLTLLREHHRDGTVRLGRFYLRRVKRLLPMLIVVLGLTLWAVSAFGSPAQIGRFSEQAIASLVYVTNWEQILAGQSYWDGFGQINPLGHMWSLAITEQFYLVWPIVIVLILVAGRRRTTERAFAWQRSLGRPVAVLVIGLAALALAAAQPMLRFDGSNSDRMYLGTDTHVAGLIAGSVAASVVYLWLRRSAVRAQRGKTSSLSPVTLRVKNLVLTVTTSALSAGVASTIVLLSLMAHDYSQEWLYRWGFAAVAVLGAVLVVTLTSKHNVVVRVLAFKPLVEIGKVSYTLFLVHLPIYWLILAVQPYSTPVDLLIIGLPASLLLASALHHLVAEPIRMRRWKFKGTTAFVSAVAATAAGVLLVPSLAVAKPMGTGDTTVLTLGDSLANDFAAALALDESARFTVVDGGLPGCGISGGIAQRTAGGVTQKAPATCNPWEERWKKQIAETRPDVIVVNLAWDAVTQNINGRWSDLRDPEFAQNFRNQLGQLASITEPLGIPVLIADSRLYSGVIEPEQAHAFNTLLAEFVATRSTIHALNLQEQVCGPDECSTVLPDGSARYIDDRVHFSAAGKAALAPWLAEAALSVRA
ncbi:peptidoglycan/LPS O-acetylase OafA/YrhL [Microterricola gilva]|uniref:Peptidoglycan/LPS O-acetylase OafA/YrhL n=1 Tax=Microterricola gilva TaxID=393267 RepID=A0A4Q8AMS5_9MICO|nr:acyltransferase family protein [Microterricola gilva]RZU65910.1 peptidoglycan/LPS O-acetylase OafA/YrhL [Microterricola gilva]